LSAAGRSPYFAMQYPAMVISAAKAIITMQISAMARIKRNCVPVKKSYVGRVHSPCSSWLPCVHKRMALFVKNPDMRPQFHGMEIRGTHPVFKNSPQSARPPQLRGGWTIFNLKSSIVTRPRVLAFLDFDRGNNAWDRYRYIFPRKKSGRGSRCFFY